MTSDIHERARMLIALAGPEANSNSEQSWLAAHLESCVTCRSFAENSAGTIRALRAIPITAGGELVAATQMRVRRRAQELQRRQERLWMVWTCCAAVTLCTAFTTAVMWRGFEWLGQQAQVPEAVWSIGFAVCYLVPSVFAGIVLLARGTHLAEHKGYWQG